MRIFPIASAYNIMMQRVHAELADRGHQVSVELALGDEVMRDAVRRYVIQSADDPAAKSWRNINAIDDLVHAILTNTGQLTVTALAGNAAAGGVMLTAAADQVWCPEGAVLNPHYRLMGLHGSEYWTYTLPRRVGASEPARLTRACLPVTPGSALRSGLVDHVIADDAAGFRAQDGRPRPSSWPASRSTRRCWPPRRGSSRRPRSSVRWAPTGPRNWPS